MNMPIHALEHALKHALEHALTTYNEDWVYYTDPTNDQVVMCDLGFNKHLKSVGSRGSGKSQFREPYGIFFIIKRNGCMFVIAVIS
jgi:hypothetical protein